MDFDIDMSRFHDSFFEEAEDGIRIMEQELLNMASGIIDDEIIHTIFRAAHSIKGSASTFGFENIGKFTHSIETVLDKLRNSEIDISQETTTLLLESTDCLSIMLAKEKAGDPHDTDTTSKFTHRLDALTTESTVGVDSVAQTGTADSQQSDDQISQHRPLQDWKIAFLPDTKIFYSGNDPMRIIRELEKLGDITVDAVSDKLPALEDIDVHNCYLGWNVSLRSSASKDEIEDLFAWVLDDCKLRIENLSEKAILSDRRTGQERRTSSERRNTGPAGRRKNDRENQSIRVSTEKVDKLLNLVGELVITQSILNSVCRKESEQMSEKLQQSLEQLERNTRDLQEQTMGIRMLPVDNAFQRLPRIVHDLSIAQGKKVTLEFSGEATELDKTILEKIGDPLVHLVRNAVDHGIESPENRIENGKPEQGTISIKAIHKEGHVVIEVSDDGKGIDPDAILESALDKQVISSADSLTDNDILNLIFQPGFSTAANVSDVSGRGVGMDVVKQNITDLGGKVDIRSERNRGSTFTIRLPLTLAILDGQIVRVHDQTYIIPLHSIVETVVFDQQNIKTVSERVEMYLYRDQYIPVIKLADIFNINANAEDNAQPESGLLVIFDEGDKHTGILVDHVSGQQQVVIKSLKKNYSHVPGLTGATILGDGSVALILDVLSLGEICS